MKRFLVYLTLILSSLAIQAQSNEAQIKAQINKVAQSIRTMQCNFVQTKHLKMLNDQITSKGVMYYQQGNKLRWEYTSPYHYIFIINNNQVLLRNNRRNDVININQSKMFKEIARIMMNSVMGKSLNNTRDFKVSIQTTPTQWIATMLPQKREMKNMFKQIILHINRRQAMVSQVEMLERNGDRTIISLINTHVNKAINQNVFSLR